MAKRKKTGTDFVKADPLGYGRGKVLKVNCVNGWIYGFKRHQISSEVRVISHASSHQVTITKYSNTINKSNKRFIDSKTIYKLPPSVPITAHGNHHSDTAVTTPQQSVQLPYESTGKPIVPQGIDGAPMPTPGNQYSRLTRVGRLPWARTKSPESVQWPYKSRATEIGCTTPTISTDALQDHNISHVPVGRLPEPLPKPLYCKVSKSKFVERVMIYAHGVTRTYKTTHVSLMYMGERFQPIEGHGWEEGCSYKPRPSQQWGERSASGMFNLQGRGVFLHRMRQ